MSTALPVKRKVRCNGRKRGYTHLPVLEPGPHAGPGYCGQGLGRGTTHPGVGRCKAHAGRPPTHGRYSPLKRAALADSIAAYEADPDPLNTLPELAAMRALFQDFIDRYDEWRELMWAWYAAECESRRKGNQPRPLQLMDMQDAYRLLSEITRTVKRIEDTHAANAISRPELYRMMGEMGRVVEHHVTDETKRDKIRDGWLNIHI